LGFWLGVSSAPASAASVGHPRTAYRIEARLSLTAPHIDGTVTVAFSNHSRRTLDEAVFFLFPNRFAGPDEGINDFNRPFIYPEKDFDPGLMEILEAGDGEAPATVEVRPLPDPPPLPEMATGEGTVTPKTCLLTLRIAPLAPGATRTLMLRFRTRVPYRFGTFGIFDRQLTLAGGWYPYLARLSADGTWQTDGPPPLADFDVQLTVGQPLEVLVNGAYFSGDTSVSLALSAVHFVSLVAAPQLVRSDTVLDAHRIVLFRRPTHRSSRISPEPDLADIVLETLRDIVELRPPVVPPPPENLVVVEAPLRLNLTAPGEGMVLISDRSLEVHSLLRPFHELQLAQAAYAELLRPTLSGREPDGDYWWVSEGLTRALAQRFVTQARPGTRSVQAWIDRFNIFAIVDRFESVPKIPFVEAFFERARVADPLHAEVTTFNNSLPPGRVVLGKLREVIGAERFDTLVDRCTAETMPLRGCAAEAAGQDVDWVFTQWLQPYPALNYSFDMVELNEPAAAGFGATLMLRRAASRPITEPVTVRLRSIGGRFVDLRWDGRGEVVQLTGETPHRVWQAVIDPERKLIEDRSDDNARPPSPQVVLDTAEVEISSTEFGFSGLVVGRDRYDYRKDLALGGFYTNRSIGFTAGARRHWGSAIDATSYRHNLYGFYGFEGLNGSFTDERQPGFRTHGQVASLGVRYDYTNVFSYDAPSQARNLRLYADWYDHGFGSDFNYVDWGASVVLTQPLWSYRTIAAGELLNGFSEPLGSSVVPNQGLYSLGGSRSIRGIGAEDELGRNILVVRAEVRQDVYPELDLNFLDLLVLRRAQVRLFADSGRVSNSAGQVYDVGSFALGVGTGLAAVYEFMGFFPSVAYIEIATRADGGSRTGEVQVLFGTRQSF